jgi:hypothetical protein
MSIFSSLKKAAQTFVEDINTPESFKKGQKFEDFTREIIFTSDRYKLLKKTHDYKQNSADYVQESLEPDFKFECLETKKQFYVEAKFRSWFCKGKLEIFKEAQFKRLKEINKKEIVFVIIGIDNEPDDPTYVCLVPMNNIKYPSLNEKFLEDYGIAHNVSISPKRLWALIDNNSPGTKKNKINTKSKKAGVKVGYCIRCKDELKIDIDHPFCKSCYYEWNKYKNPDYIEKYCHVCGKQKKVTFEKPICYSCYKNK